MTRIDNTLPITNAKIAAARATIPPKSQPTSGIQFSIAITGEKRR